MADKNKIRAEEISAFHEAGHAVACYLLKIVFSYVTIRSGNGDGPRVQFNSQRRVTLPCSRDQYEGYKILRDRLEREFLMTLAGQIAQGRIQTSYIEVPLVPYDEIKKNPEEYREYLDALSEANASASFDHNDLFDLFRLFKKITNVEDAEDLVFKSLFKYSYCKCHEMLYFPENWCAVEALANELMKKPLRKIKYRKAREIIETARNEYLKKLTRGSEAIYL